METELRHHLTTCAGAFALLTGLGLATIGRKAAKDWRFFDRLTAGDGFTARKYDDVIGWFDENWPEDGEWPSDVPRPSRTDASEAVMKQAACG